MRKQNREKLLAEVSILKGELEVLKKSNERHNKWLAIFIKEREDRKTKEYTARHKASIESRLKEIRDDEKRAITKDLQFRQELLQIISTYKDGTSDNLSKDETARLKKILHLQIDLLEGNITEREYEEGLDEAE